MPRKLTDKDNKEQAIGEVMEDGTTYLYEELINRDLSRFHNVFHNMSFHAELWMRILAPKLSFSYDLAGDKSSIII
jgi:hypothetical protein